jgi:sulfide:quinone oxidoreductase
VRDDVELTHLTPLDAAFAKPVMAAQLAGLLRDEGIRRESELATGSVDREAGRLVSGTSARSASTIPLHCGAAFVERSPGLGDDLGFIPTDPRTLQSTAAPNVFAIGDATNVPTSGRAPGGKLRRRAQPAPRRPWRAGQG